MTKKASLAVALVVSACAFLLVTPSCSKKAADAGWKVEVSVVDGVKTIRNPATPRYGTFTFDLAEDLVIGEEKDENLFLPGGVTIAVDAGGAIYACDYDNRRVQVYDREGRFVRTLGRVGQGPGEYSFPSAVYIDDSGDVLVDADRSLVVFGPDGIFKKNVPIKALLLRKGLGPGGMIVGTTQPSLRTEGGPKNTLVQLGPDGELRRTLAEFPAFGASPGQMLFHWYSGWIAYCRRDADALIYGFSLEAVIHVADREGREVLTFSKPEVSQKITAEEEALTRKEGIGAWFGRGDPKTAPLGMPDHRPYYRSFLCDDRGRLFVVRFRPITEKDAKGSEVDVFSKDGLYLYRMTWPFIPQVIKGGFLYEVRQDEEAGLTKIIRHKVANWAELRSE